MIFKETKLDGLLLIEPVRIDDSRGFFARIWCEREFKSQNLEVQVAQCSIAVNTQKHTVRGMHFQNEPHAETKIVRCTHGAIYDVVLDLRAQSKTYLQWQSFELSAENRNMLYIPKGFAHGYQTLTETTEIFYQMSEFYVPEAASGVLWNDPAFKIKWPSPNQFIISDKDAQFKKF